ncbi:MAG: 23S rRNA (uracil(1939)-C(5))-methyltransferase RlmD [Deltaproteobacteria bacterium]|nr:23S rRNA (uracil(1939)-C(5))-methyltransferase RlmD [Deltaproteobacteria bacterium]
MTIKKGQILELKIERVIFGGRGLATVDGFRVMVEQAIPGDVVRARVFRKKRNYAEARIIELIEPSADRIFAPCRYHGFCGGCTWQCLRYDRQVAYKTQQVRECLEHIGGLEGVRVAAGIGNENLYRYRNKMEFSFSDRRWLLPVELHAPGVSVDFALGLHVPGTFHKVLDVDRCLLQSELGNKLLADVRRYARNSGIAPYGLKSHQGFWRFLMLRHSAAHDQWMVNIVTSGGRRSWVQPLADRLFSAYDAVCSVIHNVNTRRAAIAVGEYEQILAGRGFIIDQIGGYAFKISANSFFQTNTVGAQRLYQVVQDYAGLTGQETVVDLYSGTGTIPVFLSNRAAGIVGIEISESAVQDAEENCRTNHINNCRFICGDILLGLARIHHRPDVVIIDPPRAGMHPDVVKAVADMAPERIVYVSCNPASLARDLAMLKERYHVVEVQPVDMFPQTYHIECVARLDRISDLAPRGA